MSNKQKTDMKVVTPAPSVSTPPATPSTIPTSATETGTSTPQCNPFVCGQQNSELQRRVDLLEQKIQTLEETAEEKRLFFKKAEGLLTVFRVVLIAIPIVLFIALAVVQYFCYNDSKLLNIVTSVIGVIAVAECIFLPILWKQTADKVTALEEKLNTK